MYKDLTFEAYRDIVSDYNENGGDITYLLSELDKTKIKMTGRELNKFRDSLILHLEAFNERENDRLLTEHFHNDHYDLSMTERVVGDVYEFVVLELLNNKANNVYTIVIERIK